MLELLATTYALEHHICLSCALLHHICNRPARYYTTFSTDLRATTPHFRLTCALLHPMATLSCALEHHILLHTQAFQARVGFFHLVDKVHIGLQCISNVYKPVTRPAYDIFCKLHEHPLCFQFFKRIVDFAGIIIATLRLVCSTIPQDRAHADRIGA